MPFTHWPGANLTRSLLKLIILFKNRETYCSSAKQGSLSSRWMSVLSFSWLHVYIDECVIYNSLLIRVTNSIHRLVFRLHEIILHEPRETKPSMSLIDFWNVFWLLLIWGKNALKSSALFAAGIHFQLAEIHPSQSVCRLLYYNISCGWSDGCAVDCHPPSSRCCVRILPAEGVRSSHRCLGCRGCVCHTNKEVVHSSNWKKLK